MKTRIIRLITILTLLLFSFSLTACSQLTDEEIDVIKDLMNANDITVEQLRAFELTPEVKDVICDVIADECEKKGVEIDREFLKSLDLDFTALAEYKIDEEDFNEFRSNMNWDPEITKTILDNMGVDEKEFNEKIKETGLTEDELLVLLEAANDPSAEGIEDVLNNPKVREIGVNLHISVPELGINLNDVPVGEIVDAAEESAYIASQAGDYLNKSGVPVDRIKSYLTPPKITTSDVVTALEPVGTATKKIAENIDPTIIQDVIEGKSIDFNKLVPVDGYDELINEAQGYVDQLIEEEVPDEVAKFIGLVLAVDHSDL